MRIALPEKRERALGSLLRGNKPHPRGVSRHFTHLTFWWLSALFY